MKLDPYTRVVDPERYRPLIRLLGELDDDAPRDRIRAYLRSLRDDHSALHAQLRLIVVHSPADRPDLAKLLIRNRVWFAVALCRIELRLRLHGLGFGRSETLAKEVLALVDGLRALMCESAVWGA